MELRTVDENKLVLTVRLASSSSENAAGWTRLGVVASRQMQAVGCDIEDPRLSRCYGQLQALRTGCGSQLLRWLGALRTVPPCFRHWRRLYAAKG